MFFSWPTVQHEVPLISSAESGSVSAIGLPMGRTSRIATRSYQAALTKFVDGLSEIQTAGPVSSPVTVTVR